MRGVLAQRPRQGAVWAPVGAASTRAGSGQITDAGGQVVDETQVSGDGSALDVGSVPAGLGGCATCGAAPDRVGPACVSCGGFGEPGFVGPGPPGGWFRPWPHHLSLSLGVQGFKGPVDRGINGNFGFSEGMNWSAALGRHGWLGYQVGVRTLQSNIEGDQVVFPRTADRDQVFLTAGLFHRATGAGWQWGLAYDYLHDRYYFGRVDLGQLRTELSWRRCDRWEVGFWGAFGVTNDRAVAQGPLVLEPTDQYAFFYRRRFARGGNFRLWAGFTGQSDGLLGADLVVPIAASLALENNFNYLIPDQRSALGGQMEESWGASIRLVWYPGRIAKRDLESPFHPLFNVADNSMFLVDFR